MGKLNVKVGDNVALCNFSPGVGRTARLAKVIKVTPTGRIQVDKCPNIYYNAFGQPMGNHQSVGWHEWLEELTPEVFTRIKEQQAINTCLFKMHSTKQVSYEQAVKILGILGVKEYEAINNG